jgi:hypothetical protein
LWLSNASGSHVAGGASEASYSATTSAGQVHLRWRETPPTLRGISIPGDDLGVDGSVRVRGDLRVVGRAYASTTETVDADLASRGHGGAVGVRLTRGARRLEVRGNYRDSQYGSRNVRRTVSLTAAAPVGPFTLSGTADVGDQESRPMPGVATRAPAGTHRAAFYQGSLRWFSKETGTFSLNASHSETAGASRQRVDALAALTLRGFEFAGGAWFTRGYAAGGRPGAWTSLGLPIGFDWLLTAGVDYTPLTWTAEPSLRGTVSLRKRFSMPMPFVRPAALSGPTE